MSDIVQHLCSTQCWSHAYVTRPLLAHMMEECARTGLPTCR